MSRKSEILDAVIDIFQTKGLEADFSISELARKVDIGKSTIYEYFTTKEEILSEAFIRIFERSIELIQNRQIDMSLSFEELFKNEMKFVLMLAKESSHIFRYIMPMQDGGFPKHLKGSGIAKELRNTAQHFEQQFRAIVQKGVEEGILKITDFPIQTTLLAALVGGSVNRIGNLNAFRGTDIDIDQYIDAMYDLALHIFQ